MKRFFKIGIISFLSLISLFYLIFAISLLWSKSSVDIKGVKESFRVNSKEVHQFILIDSGLNSLKRRVSAIEDAKDSIELEYFIYELDLAAQIISFKLIEAAKRGVKVKILVDSSAPVFKLGPEYAKFLDEENIEVKYYNTAPLVNFIKIQHRSHRKFLIIDSIKLITGGRNIGNDYFALSEHYNFLDSDIEVTGPIIKKVKASFLKYWNSDFAETPSPPNEEVNLDFVQLDKIHFVLKFLERQNYDENVYDCSDVDFVTDSPGVDVSNRHIYRYLEEKLKKANQSLVVESPYFVLREDGLNLINELSDRKIVQTYLTNSLFSTDAFYTISAMIPVLKDLKKSNVRVLLYSGEDLYKKKKRPYAVSKRWGLHAKRAVIDSKHTLVGTYNIDPRSANLNSEVLISCNNNTKIAEATLKSMQIRQKNSWPLFSNDSSGISNLMKNTELVEKAKFILIFPLAHLFNFLL